jgi:hypothetical protein
MGKNTKIVGGILLIAIILVAVAYAAITNVGLNINGVGNAQAKQENFKVEFIGTPSTSGKGTTTATISSDDKTQGSVNVTGLNAKGDEAVATYTVKNQSSDISADLTAEATSSNEEYFEVICSLEKTTLKAQEETILKVTVRLLKTPIDETKENLKSDIGVSIKAEPKQPGEEANGGSETVSSKKTTKPYLPTGFTQVSGTTLKNGLTIQDSTGNQYVWIEVPMTEEVYPTAGLSITNFTEEEYTAIETDLHTYTDVYRDGTSNKDEYYSEVGLTNDQYTNLKKTMLKSVYQNGGFYIGKYETGIENKPKTSGSADTAPTETPVIKRNAYPYNYVTCSQAQTLASNMESGNHTSSLMFGVQWDLVLKYLETKGTSQADLKTDSTNCGNYNNNLWNITNSNSKYAIYDDKLENFDWTSGAYGIKDSDTIVLLSTGASDDFSKQGIYDLAGNVFEMTLEHTNSISRARPRGTCTARGGGFYSWEDKNPVSVRLDISEIEFICNGFRVSLF